MPPKHKKRTPAGKSDEAHESRGDNAKIPDADLKIMPTKTSYYRVMEVVKGIASERFGDLARLLDTGQYYIHPAPDRPSVEELENDPGGLKAETWKISLKLSVEINGEMVKNKTKFYSFLLNRCSEALKTKMESEESFEQLHNDKDPLELFKLIKRICIEGDESSRAVDQEKCEEAYWAMRQRNKESCLDYHKRFKNIVKSLLQFGIEKTDLQQAIHFVKRLDDSRFAGLKSDINNKQSETNVETAYPPNLAKALKRAEEYTVVDNSGSQVTASMFTTKAKFGKDKKKQEKEKEIEAKEKHKKEKNQKEKKCFLCDETGHFMYNCPELQNAKECVESKSKFTSLHLAGESAVFVNKKGKNFTHEDYILLDNESQGEIIKNAELLTNIRKASHPMTFIGIGGSDVTTSTVGDLPKYGTVYYSPNAIANVLSFGMRAKQHCIEYVRSEDKFSLFFDDGERHDYKNHGNLYAFDARKLVNVHTVKEAESGYTSREISAAREAKELVRRLGYPSPSSVINSVNKGFLINSPISANDLYRAYKIYGPDIAALKGKSVASPSAKIKAEYVERPIVKVQQLFVDIMYVNEEPYLLGVILPIDLTIVHYLEGRSMTHIKNAIYSFFAKIIANGFVINYIFTDIEKSILSLESQLNVDFRVKVNPAGAGEKVAVIERRIRTIKERVRSIRSVLPFRPANILTKWLVYFAVMRKNLISTKADTPPPKELFTGLKVNYKCDLRVGFGDYCQVYKPNGRKNNVNEDRTEGAIALLPSGNLQGSVKFLSLSSLKIITRDKWTALPMPQEVIDYLNKLSDKTPSKEPIFRINDRIIDESIDDAAELEHGLSDPPVIDQTERVINAEDFVPNDIEDDDINNSDIGEDCADTIDNDQNDNSVNDLEPVINNFEDATPASNDAITDDNMTTADQYSEPIVEDSNSDTAEQYSEPIVEDYNSDTSTPRYPSRERGNWKDGPARLRDKHSFHITVQRALNKMRRPALIAMFEQMKSILDKDTWKPFRRMNDKNSITDKQFRKAIRCHLFLKEKYLPNGDFEKLKARLVAGGNDQDRELYDSVKSPTASLTSILLVAQIAALEKREVCHIDIGSAYLNAKMPEDGPEVIMQIDGVLAAILLKLKPEYEQYSDNGKIYVKLNKALYGCVESALLWYKELRTTLEADGFAANNVDPCVFNKINAKGNQITIAVYVDDLLLTCVNVESIDEVNNMLVSKYGEVNRSDGPILNYVGMTLDFSSEGEVKLSMKKYIDDIIDLYQVSGDASTPANKSLFNVDTNAEKLSDSMRETFHSRVAKLLYLAKRVRVDILLPISFLATRVTCATVDDWKKLDRVLKYLNSTKHLILTLQPHGYDVYGYADASYGVHHDLKSHNGNTATTGKGVFYSQSTKQKINTRSSTEAEFVSASDFVSRVISFREFMIAQGHYIKPVKVYQDNTSTIKLIKNGRFSSMRTKHIASRYFFITDRIASNEISVEYMPTNDMLADIFTKPLQGNAFKRLRDMLLNIKV